MGFASSWLKEKALFPELIKEAPSRDTGIIVVVPAYDEPGITDLLESLKLCHEPDCIVEVIIVVNHPSGASSKSLINNSKSIASAELWKNEHHDCFFRLFVIDGSNLRSEGWSVGMARKAGMDEALRRFDLIKRPDGIILNLDADCKVKNNYFTAVYNEFHCRKDRSACSIYFEHEITGNEYSRNVYRSVILYELHLRYFLQGLAYAGFPYVHHTVGSAIAVRAMTYMNAGGMNRRMAGEDFYFIQKLLPAGGYFNLNLTTVYPSPRLSSRVPFGTGATISRMSAESNEIFLTYNVMAFEELRALFRTIDTFFQYEVDDPDLGFDILPQGVKQFTGKEEWMKKLREIKSNTSGINSFRKRFFGWFNMLRIVRYLNSVHRSFMQKKPVEECAGELLDLTGRECKTHDPEYLLDLFRKMEQNG